MGPKEEMEILEEPPGIMDPIPAPLSAPMSRFTLGCLHPIWTHLLHHLLFKHLYDSSGKFSGSMAGTMVSQ